MKAVFHTLGCKLNQVETEAMAAAFTEQGIGLAGALEHPDIIIINTCTVTSKSEQKARRVIRRFLTLHGDALLIITGCYAQVEYRYLCLNFSGPYHALVIPQEQKHRLLELPGILARLPRFAAMSREGKYKELRRRLGESPGRAAGAENPAADTENPATGAENPAGFESQAPGGETGTDGTESPAAGNEYRAAGIITVAAGPRERFAFHTPSYHFHSRAFLKIQDGCGNACAYCRVPLARGGSQSLAAAEALSRVEELAAAGFREIVLTGVNIGDYRADGYDLKRLVRELLDSTSRVRFRLSSLEPEIVETGLCAVLAHERVCPHFHLSLQSGSDRMLAAMRRRSTTIDIRRAAALLRGAGPDAFLAADVIAGFPGESDEDFEETVRLIGELGLHKLHVFPFSARPGTFAYTLRQRVPAEIIRRRTHTLLELSKDLYEKYLASCTGRRVWVVLEQRMKNGGWQGSCENSLKCRLDLAGGGEADARLEKGMLVEARVTGREGETALKADFLAVDRNLPAFSAPGKAHTRV
jgi:threonylcarbamoyladenosine tRNA methylthiotransferase MtaB